MNLNFLKFLKPEWRKIVLFIILFLILPQKVSNDIILFGGVSIIKFLFESQPPDLDLIVTVIVLIVSYLLSCILVWIYDNKINKFIISEGEVDVSPPEERESKEKGKEEKEEEEGPP
ncbi:MAG: hypothetical protein GTN40_02965 [Candidatus Aenigmarchaeota archaeon]|nr:hypothetical protein [Candidatus Aenigmarchaeota archaeon]